MNYSSSSGSPKPKNESVSAPILTKIPPTTNISMKKKIFINSPPTVLNTSIPDASPQGIYSIPVPRANKNNNVNINKINTHNCA